MRCRSRSFGSLSVVVPPLPSRRQLGRVTPRRPRPRAAPPSIASPAMADLGFDGKVAIITGAGGGLGRQHALALAGRGALVVVNDLGGAVDGSGSDAGAAELVVDEIKAAGGEAVADTNSVVTPRVARRSSRPPLDAFGRVDIVDQQRRHPARQDVPQHVPPTCSSRCSPSTSRARSTLPSRRGCTCASRAPGGSCSTSSAAGILGNFGQTNYGAAKMGLVGLTRVLAIEGARYGIKANAIAPLALTRDDRGHPRARMGQQLDPRWSRRSSSTLPTSRARVTGMSSRSAAGASPSLHR